MCSQPVLLRRTTGNPASSNSKIRGVSWGLPKNIRESECLGGTGKVMLTSKGRGNLNGSVLGGGKDSGADPVHRVLPSSSVEGSMGSNSTMSEKSRV